MLIEYTAHSTIIMLSKMRVYNTMHGVMEETMY